MITDFGAIIVVNCLSYFLESEFTEFNQFSEFSELRKHISGVI